MEKLIVDFFKELMRKEEIERLNASNVLEYIKSSDLNEDDKEHIMECVQEHISCEKQRNEEIANGDEDVLEEKTLTVSPYGGCYTLECEWCNSVVTDLELLLDECEE